MTKYFEAKLNNKEFLTQFKKISEQFANLKPVFKIVRKSLLKLINDNFKTEGVSSGEKWEPWSDNYAQLREKKGGLILNFSGALRKSFTSKLSSTSLIIGTAKEYAAIHNFGGDIKARNGLSFEMPQREFFRFTNEQLWDILGEIEHYYLKNIKYIDKKQ